MSGFHNGDPDTNGEYALMRSIADRISVFADIGYNHGFSSDFMAKVQPGVKIIGFEPNPQLAKEAKHKIIMTALSDEAVENHSFHIHDKETGVSSLSQRTEFNPSFRSGFTQIKVGVAKLDNFISELNPQQNKDLFLKIDVEGYEAKVIRGGQEVLRKFKPIGYFEYANGWLEAKERFRDLFYHLDSIDYSCYRITPLGLEHLRFFHYIMENYIYQNIFFCPKDYLDGKLNSVEIPNEFSTTRFFTFNR